MFVFRMMRLRQMIGVSVLLLLVTQQIFPAQAIILFQSDVDYSAAVSFKSPQYAADPSTCEVGQQYFNTTSNVLKLCTAVDTWTTLSAGGGSQDFESVYTTDADDTLTTSNAAFTIVTGTNDFIVDSNDWNITAAGALDAATVTSNGALTATGTTNLNGAAKFNGTTTIGDNGDTVAVNSSAWDISTAGIASGFTGITSSGTISFTAGATISGGTINLNDASNNAVNIGTGSSTGTVTVGGTGTQTIALGTGAGVKTVGLGSTNTTSATTINSGSGNINLTGHAVLSSDSNEGLSGGGLTDCDASNQSVQWDSTTSKFSCTTASNDTATFTDTSPATFADNSTTELFNDATKPNITTDSSTSTVLITFTVRGTSSDGDNETNAVYVVRGVVNTDPVCNTDPQVGQVVSGFSTESGATWSASAAVLDTPGAAGQFRYNICTSTLTTTSGDQDTAASAVNVNLIELGN